MKNILLLLTATVSFSSFSATELKGSPEELKTFLHPNENIITITRSAEYTVFKDVAIINLSAITEDKTLSNALQKNSKLRAKISKILIKGGILQKDINNSKFSSSPDYGWFGNKPDSYKVNNVISVRISDESGLEKVAKVVDMFEEVTLLNTTYEHSKKEEYIDKVKTKALDNVLNEKEFYAKKLGIKLQPVSFRDNNSNPANDIEVIQLATYRSPIKKESYSSMSKAAGKTSFDQLIYKAKVSVSFKVK